MKNNLKQINFIKGGKENINITQMTCDPGKKWVKEQFQKEAQNKGIDLFLEWGPFKVSTGTIFLEIIVGGKRIIKKFSREELDDCLKPGETQNDLHNYIQEIIESL